MSSNTIEVIIRATDSATGTLRAVTREIEALAARITSAAARIQSVNLAALTAPLASVGLAGTQTLTPFVASPVQTANGGLSGEGLPFAPRLTQAVPSDAANGGDTFITVQVALPESALREPAQVQSLGETFGDAIARRLRERG